MRYIKVKTAIDGEVWINTSHIVSLEDKTDPDRLIIRLANGDQWASNTQDSIDIISMMNLDINNSCGSQIADSPGIPVRTMLQPVSPRTARTLKAEGWVQK